jgi:hypothetical protein
VDGDVNGELWEEPRMIDVGRRDGGGGGTLTLSDLGLLFSFLLMLILSSSAFGDNLPVVLLRVNFDSETS